MRDSHRASVGCYLGKADMKGRKIETPILESVKAGRLAPVKRRGCHWFSAFINRLRFEGRKQYSKRGL